MNKCKGLNRTGEPCSKQAMNDSDLCFSHSQITYPARQADIFLLSPDEIEYRIHGLTWKQVEALELLCSGETYHSAGVILGIDSGTFTNRVSAAIKRADVRTRSQLICLYAIWRFWQYTKEGKPMV